MRSSLAAAFAALAAMPIAAQSPRQGLTAVDGLKVGHFTLTSRPTGCTVILAERGAVAGVDVRGAAPGTRETDLLNPINLVQQVNAIVLSGGSAFGLDAASGVMKYLEERNIGYDVRVAKVPIVPAAILFDLNIGDPKIHPDASCGYKAAAAATTGPIAEGDVGAGAGATVGKLAGAARAMKGGLGTASITLSNGLTVAAIVAVNAVGDVIDPATGAVVAGARTADGSALLGSMRALLHGDAQAPLAAGSATTLAVVATDAALTKAEANKMAQMAHDGLARSINPVHTMYDGDVVFALATGTNPRAANLTLIGALAAEVLAESVLRGVLAARGLRGDGLPDLPAACDM
ncbi:MAG: P1 family peptidase [Caldimonas sp.]